MSVQPSDPTTSRETPPQHAGVHRALLLAMSDIKIAHSVFALPFALLGAFLAAPTIQNAAAQAGAQHQPGGEQLPALLQDSGPIDWPTFTGQLALIVWCMFFARTWAMLVNRLADWKFDKENPRTARRVFASGRLSVRAGWAVAFTAAGLFLLGCAAFFHWFSNPWPLYLGVPVLGWIALYSYTKRFTALAHLFLGSALAISPPAAALAVGGMDVFVRSGETTDTARALLALFGFVLLWVAGFDIAYALQDLEFDRRRGLRSIPARLGWRGSLWVSRVFHACAAGLLFAAVFAEPRLRLISAVACGAVALLLVFEHIVLLRRGLNGLPMAFFTVNGVASVLFGSVAIVDVLRCAT